MKVNLELNIPDERLFLNFWNWSNGDDVVCQIKDGKLYLHELNDTEREITLSEFCEMVKTRMIEINKDER